MAVLSYTHIYIYISSYTRQQQFEVDLCCFFDIQIVRNGAPFVDIKGNKRVSLEKKEKLQYLRKSAEKQQGVRRKQGKWPSRKSWPFHLPFATFFLFIYFLLVYQFHLYFYFIFFSLFFVCQRSRNVRVYMYKGVWLYIIKVQKIRFHMKQLDCGSYCINT